MTDTPLTAEQLDALADSAAHNSYGPTSSPLIAALVAEVRAHRANCCCGTHIIKEAKHA